ncbi:MAG: M20 family peptidase [Nitrospinota bacterium]|nr:MAG: M20 family peptidase [Nitrospinota bacterium]
MRYFRSEQDAMLAFLQEIVRMESPTTDKAAVDRLGRFLEAELTALGATVKRYPQQEVGDHLIAEWGEGEEQYLILCHIDTVWPIGSPAQNPIRVEDGRAYGPAIFDMKAGVTIALYALKGLRALGVTPPRRVVLLFNTDEEIGSPTSRPLIEEEARKSAYALCLEPPIPPQGALKTFRKGVGRFDLKITGRAAHSGADHDKGISAIQELAHQILKLHSLTDYEKGTTVNVGVVGGGTRPNVVAEQAWAEIDLRVSTMEEGERLTREILSLQPVTPGTRVEVTGGLNRPPMERTPTIVQLFQQAQAIGAELGLSLVEAGTGGGSDGQFAAALGVPTLDGLGCPGDGGHAVTEHILVQHLPERAALLASLLLKLP